MQLLPYGMHEHNVLLMPPELHQGCGGCACGSESLPIVVQANGITRLPTWPLHVWQDMRYNWLARARVHTNLMAVAVLAVSWPLKAPCCWVLDMPRLVGDISACRCLPCCPPAALGHHAMPLQYCNASIT